MGREIEIKIPLTDLEYNRILSQIQGDEKAEKVEDITFGKTVKLFKQDEYYSLYDTRQERLAAGEPQVLRIRTEDDGTQKKSYFTIKFKTRQNGVELNKEDETFVENPEVIRELFEVAKYKRWFNKEKDAWSVHCESKVLPGVDFHLELEKVNNLPYVEIEVTDEQGDADVIKKALSDFVKLLGLNPENKDSRSWVEIISGAKPE